MADVNARIAVEGSYPITMYPEHFPSNTVLLTVGRIDRMYMEDGRAIFEATIADTSAGKDVQALIEGGFIKGVSIRAIPNEVRKTFFSGEWVDEIVSMTLEGIDFTNRPGVNGAQVVSVIESLDGGGNNMTNIYESLTLEELKAKRQDLFESIRAEFTSLMEPKDSQISSLTESLRTLKNEKDGLSTKIAEAEAKIIELTESVNTVTAERDTLQAEKVAAEKAAAQAKLESFITESLVALGYSDGLKTDIREAINKAGADSEDAVTSIIESEKARIEKVLLEAKVMSAGGWGQVGENGSPIVDKEYEDLRRSMGL